MTFAEIFAEYYVLFRGDSDVPATTDDEWLIAIRLANNAVKRWANVDGVLWNELWTDTETNGAGAVLTVATGDSTYAAPTDMKSPGGFIFLTSGDRSQKVGVINPEEDQLQGDTGTHAYFTGNPNTGFVLNLFVAGTPASDYNGWTISYPYYKKPTLLTTAEDGTTTLETPDPAFIIHDMLANRFRATRNSFGYQTAKRDADQALVNMINRNFMGTPYGGPTMADPLGGVFGQ